MALQVTVNGVDVTDLVLWDETTFEEAANEGQIGTGTLSLRDQPGTLSPLFGWPVILKEGGTVRWRGIVAPDTRGRDNDTDRVGPRRVVRITLNDSNYLFDHASIDGTVRPSENGVVRVKALFATERSSVDRTTFVPSSGLVTMDARTYTDVMLRDGVADCAETEGKDYWIDRDLALHYVTPAAAGGNTAPITLTDSGYVADISGGGSAFNIGLIRQNTDPFSIPLQTSLTLKYGPGDPPAQVTVTDNPLGITGPMEGPPVYDDRAQSSATASARATALLRYMSVPEIRYETTVALPNLSLRAGHYVSLTSSPLGLSATSLKVASMSSQRIGNKDAGYWQVTLQINAPKRFVARAKGFIQTSAHNSFGTPGSGQAWHSAIWDPGTPYLSDSFFTWNANPDVYHLVNSTNYRETDVSATIGNTPFWRWRLLQGYWNLNTTIDNPFLTANPEYLWSVGLYRGTWTTIPSSSEYGAGVLVMVYSIRTADFGNAAANPVSPSPWVYPGSAAQESKIKVFARLQQRVGLPIFGADTGTCLDTQDNCAFNMSVIGLNPPDSKKLLFEYQWTDTATAGQWVYEAEVMETANGARTRFTTLQPYTPGSLRVKVDGVFQPVTEISPYAGTFDLPFAPQWHEIVTADYVIWVLP